MQYYAIKHYINSVLGIVDTRTIMPLHAVNCIMRLAYVNYGHIMISLFGPVWVVPLVFVCRSSSPSRYHVCCDTHMCVSKVHFSYVI